MGFLTVFLLYFLYQPSAFALHYEVVGPCSPKAVFEGEYNLKGRPETLGEASLEIFERDHIPYLGAEHGMNSILNTPTGEDALEILSREEMRAYGWCFKVDGKRLDSMPDEVKLLGGERIEWFYGFAHYYRGQWLSLCEPAYTVQPAKLCPGGSSLPDGQ